MSVLPAGMAVLLVDDDEDDRFLVQQAWEQAGIGSPLRALEGGEQALEYLSGAGSYADRARFPLPGLVLLDIKMPGMSGFDVLRWIRANERLPGLPVVMFTASTSPRDVAEAFRLGANAFVIKPSSLEELTDFLGGLKQFWLRFNEYVPAA